MLALIAGLVSLFIDSKDKTRRWLFLLALGTTAALTIFFNHQESIKGENALKVANQEKAETRQVLLNITEHTNEIPELVASLRKFGFIESKAQAATLEAVGTAFEANNLYSESLARVRQNPDPSVKVAYFPKDVDGEKVSSAIRDAGFTVVEGRAKQTLATNSVWAGDAIHPDEWKLVCFALMRAGVGIVSVRAFRDGAGSKAKLIQVGAEPVLVGKTPLTPSQIAQMGVLTK